MNNLFNPSDIPVIIKRIEKLTPETQRQWGKMNVAQMLAHCNKSVETAMGQNFMKPLFIGKIIGVFMKSKVIGEKPFGKNSPTDKSYIFPVNCNFEEEKS